MLFISTWDIYMAVSKDEEKNNQSFIVTCHQGFTSVQKKTEFLDKSSINPRYFISLFRTEVKPTFHEWMWGVILILPGDMHLDWGLWIAFWPLLWDGVGEGARTSAWASCGWNDRVYNYFFKGVNTDRDSLDRFSLRNHRANRSRLIPFTVHWQK